MPAVFHIRNGILLNFSRHPIVMLHPVTGTRWTYATAEHRFQAMKGMFLNPKYSGYTREEAHDMISKAPSPREAKALGRSIPIYSDLWDLSAFGIMLEAHIAKFSQNRDANDALMATGSAKLVEHRPDPVWGDNMDDSGQNLCGKSLMIVRSVAMER